MKKKTIPSLLSISLNRDRLLATETRRQGDRLLVTRSIDVALNLDPLTADPKLAGRELADHLAAAGIRERRCLICLPLSWALTMQVDLPDLAEEDLNAFLHIQAEREFPYALSDMTLAHSRFHRPNGGQGAVVVSAPRSHIEALQAVFRAAGLRILAITLRPAAVGADLRDSKGSAAILINRSGMDLMILGGGGIQALRRLDTRLPELHSGDPFDPDPVARELRITLGRRAESTENGDRVVYVFGNNRQLDCIVPPLNDAMARIGWRVEGRSARLGFECDYQIDTEPDIPAVAAAGRLIFGLPLELLFDIEKRKRHTKLWGKTYTRRTVQFGGAAVAIAFLFLLVLLAREWRLANLESQWKSMAPAVAQAEKLREEANRLRPWHGARSESLAIVKCITEAFPEEGSLWTTSIGIKAMARIKAECRATNPEAFETMRAALNEAPFVNDVSLPNIKQAKASQGQPASCTLEFLWSGDVQ